MSACNCAACVKLCKHTPGWYSPAEADAAIAAGLAPQLMLDYYLRAGGNVYVLCPAVKGREARRAPNTEEIYGEGIGALLLALHAPEMFPKGRCVFLQDDDKCAVHSTKPMQCREGFGCKSGGLGNAAMAKLWDNPDAQALVHKWREMVGLADAELAGCI